MGMRCFNNAGMQPKQGQAKLRLAGKHLLPLDELVEDELIRRISVGLRRWWWAPVSRPSATGATVRRWPAAVIVPPVIVAPAVVPPVVQSPAVVVPPIVLWSPIVVPIAVTAIAIPAPRPSIASTALLMAVVARRRWAIAAAIASVVVIVVPATVVVSLTLRPAVPTASFVVVVPATVHIADHLTIVVRCPPA